MGQKFSADFASTLIPFGENIRKETRHPEHNPVIPKIVRDLLMSWRWLARLDMTYFY